MMWDKLEQEVGWKNARVIAFAVWLTFSHFSYERHRPRRMIEWYIKLIPKYKKLIDDYYTAMVRGEIEEMKQSQRRDCNYLIQKYKL